MKIKDFINISPADLARMSKEDLRRLSASGASIANRRISSLVASGGQISPAYVALPAQVRKTQKFTTPRNMSKNKLIAQIQSQQGFVKSKFSTGREWAKVENQILQEYGRTYKSYRYTIDGRVIPASVAKREGITAFTRNQIFRFWDIFHKMQEAHPEMFTGQYDRDYTFDTITAIIKENPNLSADRALQILEERLNTDYAASIEQTNEEIKNIRSGKHSTF